MRDIGACAGCNPVSATYTTRIEHARLCIYENYFQHQLRVSRCEDHCRSWIVSALAIRPIYNFRPIFIYTSQSQTMHIG